MIKVVSFKICPFVQRVTGLLAAKDIPFEIEYISLSDKPDWFLEVSPNGQVPLLITEDGTALFESDAIVEYIDERYEPLEPEISLEQKALNRAWSYQATKHYLSQCGTMRSADKETFESRVDVLDKLFAKAEKAISGAKYWNSDQLSNVDIAWLPLLHRADIIERHTCFDFLAKFPKVKAWQQALLELNLVNETVSEDFEDKFTGFYLSDKTYLGGADSCAKPVLDASCKSGTCC